MCYNRYMSEKYYPVTKDVKRMERNGRAFYRVTLDPKDLAKVYELADPNKTARGTYDKMKQKPTSRYAKGARKVTSVENSAEFLGFMGEVAVAALLKTYVDTEYREQGDHYDFKVNGKTIDVKCSGNYRVDDKIWFIKVASEGSTRRQQLSCDYYIFAQRFDAKTVDVMGVETGETLNAMKTVYPRNKWGNWKNIEVREHETQDIRAFYESNT